MISSRYQNAQLTTGLNPSRYAVNVRAAAGLC